MNSKEFAQSANIELLDAPQVQWQEYKELRLSALQKEPQAFGSNYAKEVAYPDEKWQQRLANHANGTSWSVFARSDEGKLVGMTSAFRDENDLNNGSAHIFAVYVDSSMRGKGVAKALMARVLEEVAANHEIETAVLEVNTDQESAKRLYEAFGFKVIETYPQVLGDGIEHQVSKMEMSLKNFGKE